MLYNGAGHQNIPDFVTAVEEIRSFIYILYVTGHHTQAFIHIWSSYLSLGCFIVRAGMARDRFVSEPSRFQPPNA